MESKIKTVADAFAYTNRDIYVLQHLESLPQQDVLYMSAWYQRMVVTEALNKEANGGVEWNPKWGSNDFKYEPAIWLKKEPTQESNTISYYTITNASTGCGERHCFKSKELVLYFNSQFSDLLMDTMIPSVEGIKPTGLYKI